MGLVSIDSEGLSLEGKGRHLGVVRACFEALSLLAVVASSALLHRTQCGALRAVKSSMGTYLLGETHVVASARLHGFKGESRNAAVKYLLE